MSSSLRERSSRPGAGTIAGQMVVLALVFTLASAHHAAAATITVAAKRSGDTIVIQANALLKADAATAWRVLTDYDRYTEFIPNLRESHVVTRRGSTAMVEESGDATLWLFQMPLNVTFEITEFAPNRLQSHAVAGSLRSLESKYQLTPTPSGVRLDYTGRVEPGFKLLAPIEQLGAQQNIAYQFQALAEEIERRSAEALRISARQCPATCSTVTK